VKITLWNLTANYNLNGGGLSGGASYTLPESKFGLSANIDRNGLATSAQYNGVSLGTSTANGYQANSVNWAQENINAAQNNAGEQGNEWLEGAVGSGVDFVYDNILAPIGNGIMDAGNYIIDGVQSIPQKLADLFLPQIPMPQLSFNFGSIFNGITTIPDIPGGIANDLNGMSGSMLSIGNSIRENAFIKKHLPFLGNLIASPLRAMYDPLNSKTYDSVLSDLKKGFDKTIDGAGNTIDIFGRDISAGWIGAVSQVGKTGIDLANVITGGNWGVSDWGNNPDLILNRFDDASLKHDMDMNEWKWLENTWSTNPSPHQWVGPIGATYSVLGSALFTPAAIVDGEVPFLPNYQDKKQQIQETNK
jgi:hypothetical protein